MSVPTVPRLPPLGSRAHAAMEERSQLATPVADWMRSEQELLSRDVNTARIMSPKLNSQVDLFKPERAASFPLHSYWVDAAQMDALRGAGLPPELEKVMIREVDGKKQYRLIIHPESRPFYRELVKNAERAPDFFATPTSSSRTMLVWPEGQPQSPFFAKLSLDKDIGGVRRTIPRSEIARSIGINNTLAQEGSADAIDGFEHSPEVLGLIPKGIKRGGMLVRTIPEGLLHDGSPERVLPMFSLYARPADGSPPLLAKMIAQSGLTPEKFIRERVIAPFVKQWFELLVKHGLSSEPHAQNVVMRLGEDGLPNGSFLNRDLGGFDYHDAYRKELGLPEAELPVLGSFAEDYHQADTRKHFGNLRTFFVEGFLYNIEKALPEWKSEGILAGPVPKKGALRKAVFEEVRRQYREVTGKSFVSLENLNAIPKLVSKARESYREGPVGGLDALESWLR